MSKLVRKTFKKFNGKVYDLCVEPSHTYNVCGKAVHNSGAGSLVNYVLGITHVDPLKYGLLFSRFLSRARCLDPEHLVLTDQGDVKRLGDVKIGDKLAAGNSTYVDVLATNTTYHTELCKITVNNEIFTCSLDHRWIVKRNDVICEVEARNIIQGDILLSCDKNHMKKQ